MKKLLLDIWTISKVIVVMLMAGLSSCRTSMPIGEQSGKADVGYMIFTSGKKYINKPIEVNVNNGEAIFTAKPVKPSQSKSNEKAYQITTGKKSIVVKSGNNIIYQGVVMLYPQETKIITLKQ